MDNRARAKHLLRHYLFTIAAHAGMRWDSDNNAEIDELCDALIDAAKEEENELYWRQLEDVDYRISSDRSEP